MKTAGVVFDFYDDPTGSVLKRTFPNASELPDVIKQAHVLTPEEHSVLRDDAFALIMVNEGKTLRKFACIDPGNTILSQLYFIETMGKLPDEAMKVAAVNLEAACTNFGVPVASAVKVAAAQARTRDPVKRDQPPTGDQDWAQRTNYNGVSGTNDSSAVMRSANEMSKQANIVDVTGKEPSPRFVKKSSSRYALGEKYPLDTYSDVVAAVDYFTWNGMYFSPEDRHQYAVKVAARAEELGIPVTESLGRYGSTEYATDVDGHLARRKGFLNDKANQDLYDQLAEKKASVDPETFAQMLSQVDRETGLNRHYGWKISDPYFSTFGGPTQAEKLAAWTWQSRTGTYVTAEQLKKLATNRKRVHDYFSSDITNAFCKEPIAIFESLPDDSKEIFARMAIDMSEGN